jgi:hypothetical protein
MDRSKLRLGVTFAAVALASNSAAAVHVWLSPSASLTASQQPPASGASIPSIQRQLGGAGGSLYIWARPDAGKTLENWSLRVVSANANVVQLTTSSVAAFNPVLGTTGGGQPHDIRRWESVSEPTAPVVPTSQGTSLLQTMQGISVIGANELGVGIGTQGAGGAYVDPYYHASANAWLLARVDYVLAGQEGESNVFLQIGSHGLNYLGESAAVGYARLGATSDPLLVGPAGRQVNSLTPEAVIAVGVTAPSADFNMDSLIDGTDFLVWQRDLQAHGGAEGLALWKEQFEAAAGRATTPVPEPAAGVLAVVAVTALFAAGRRRLRERFIPHKLILLVVIIGCIGLSGLRVMAADVVSTWDGTTGDWSDSTKWSSVDFPSNGNGGLTYDAIVNGGAVTLDQDIEIEGLTVSGGTIAGDFDLKLNATSTWTGGTMGGAGTTTIGSGGALTLSGSNGVSLHSRTLKIAGNFNWTSNIIQTASQATLGNIEVIDGGMLAITGGLFGKTFQANLEIDSGGALTHASSSVTYTDLGTFVNDGSVQVDSGTLSFNSGGIGAGSFVVNSGAMLQFAEGTHAYSGSFTGAGTVKFRAGTFDISSTTFSPANLLIDSGQINFSSSVTSNALHLTGGTLGGPTTLTFTGASTWTDGTMSGTGVTVFSSGALSGSSVKTLNDRTLRSGGAITWSAGDITTNGTRGTIHVPDGTTFTVSGTGVKYLNANLQIDAGGTLLHTSTGATVHTAGMFLNNGLVQVDAGTLQFNSGGSGTGEFVVASGASLQFNGPGHSYNGGVTLDGGVFQLTTFALTNGTVRGSGTVQATTFTNASVVSPGVAGDPVGAIFVSGAYQQASAGSLALDVQGIDAGDFDTLSITGSASLGGTLAVEAVNGSIEVGEQITIITAASLAVGDEFEDVIVTGLTDVRLVPVYVPAGGAITASTERSGSAVGDSIFASSSSAGASVILEGHPIGDLNLDGIFDSNDPAAVAADAAALAKAFVDPQGYKAEFLMPGTIMGRVNGDDYFDFDDIHAFRQLAGISMGQMMAAIRAAQAAVPEPSAWALAIAAAAALVACRRRLRF